MSSLIDLAQTIAAEAKRLADYIEENNLPNPSFAADGPAFLPIPSNNHQLKASQGRLHAAAQDLAALAFGPVEHLKWQAWSARLSYLSLAMARPDANSE